MKHEFFCVVDAGGNPYPGTFSKTDDGAIFLRSDQILLRHPSMNGIKSYRIGEIQETFAMLERKLGDRCVRCTVETNETVVLEVQA